ncbi:D-glycero-beta-D-manno-heptose 1,7-bisphosphate 7-phosphatase [Catenovulum sp. 2E275]|uniref:D-glycero-beta-D-manno-heptose 1,7-bisphosphate 7-phosphatase n=1 Tax=Catenovulum sp. 2E275 TaxID=2980497 RepID=UPI0021D0AD80|nr:D-glycero-beta-D-manno-heptose 1,7-bisphosphate 7-phosphatase [Catenovulum sp. 2E275]MCU4674222.1 D-glycero-beta-D-manno-heptose 1,7-bisphosphate 7-phosphatase [Catenovulum sp. 2E275]
MNKALLLDRDGIINHDFAYVHKIEDFKFTDHIFALCKQAQSLGYLIVVVTNQAGIARGYYTEQDVRQLHQWMIAEFAKQEITISKAYYCPHHPEYGGTQYLHNCLCRKPMPGMLLQAKREFNLDLTQSVMIGDRESDVKAALAAGVNRRILIQSDYTKQDNLAASAATEVVESLTQVKFD